MKKLLIITSLAVLTACLAFKGGDMLSIGEKAPLANKAMQDVVSGEMLSLTDLKKEHGLLVIFSCNTCPFVLGWEDQYPMLAEMSAANKIGMVLVNSNEAKREKDDSPAAMKRHHEEAGYLSPYLIDSDHRLADAMGAATTPHVYLFNANMELVYRGSINDKYEKRGEAASRFYLQNAMEALVAGKKIEPAETRQIGCSIKRVKV